jgi:hypothetical protein
MTATPSARIELARADDVEPITVKGVTFALGSTGIPFGNGGSNPADTGHETPSP